LFDRLFLFARQGPMVEKRLEADWALGKKGIKRKNANTHEI